MTTKSLWGAIATFDTPAQLYEAAKKIVDAGYTRTDAHTPFPVHGLDKVLKHGPSHVGWISVTGGIAGILLGQLMMWWMNGVDYPLWVAGKHPYAWQSTIPITFECMILLTAFGTVFGMLGINKLPSLYHPVFRYSQIGRASDDAFLLSIDARDPKFDQSKTVDLLKKVGGQHVELIED